MCQYIAQDLTSILVHFLRFAQHAGTFIEHEAASQFEWQVFKSGKMPSFSRQNVEGQQHQRQESAT